jgi:hypothetical protein
MIPQDIDTDRDKAAWRPRLSWPFLLLAGWVLYEATAQPGLAAAITCAKFGWPDFRAAWWLRRVDPDRARGQACFWYYLAFGLWKIAVLASGMMVALLFLGSIINGRPRAFGGPVISPVLSGIFVAAGVGFGLSFLATYVALWSALRHGVKVWLGTAPYHARTERFWPPRHGRTNAAPFVTVTTMILTLWGFLLTLLILAAMGRGFHAFVPALLLAAIFLAFPAFLIVFRLLDRRVFAQTPHECWKSSADEVVYEAADGEAVY